MDQVKYPEVPPGQLTPGFAPKRHRLAAQRKAVGYSQEQLAESLRVDRSTVGRWENGETAPQPWVRPKLAKALRISTDQLNGLLTRTDPASDEISDERRFASTDSGTAVDLWRITSKT